MIIHFSTSLPSVASQYLECLRHFKEFHLSRKDIQIITATVGKTRCVFRLIWAVFRLVWRSQAAFFRYVRPPLIVMTSPLSGLSSSLLRPG